MEVLRVDKSSGAVDDVGARVLECLRDRGPPQVPDRKPKGGLISPRVPPASASLPVDSFIDALQTLQRPSPYFPPPKAKTWGNCARRFSLL